MAKTLLTDVIVPEIFNRYVVEETAKKSAFWSSGIIQQVPGMTLNEGGTLVNVPFFKDLDGRPQVMDTDYEIGVNKIQSETDKARVLYFANAWASEDLAKELTSGDPMRTIASRVAAYWARSDQDVLMTMLRGVFASNVANNDGDQVLDISVDSAAGESNKVDGAVLIDAGPLHGDAAEKFTAIAMHSVVYANLRKQQLIEYLRDEDANIDFPSYLGKRIIVDDSLAPVATTDGYKYTSYMFQPGAVGYAPGSVAVPSEVERKASRSTDELYMRRSFMLHPRGFRWNETNVAGAFPTFAEMEDAANHTRVYEKKNTGIVQIVSNG